MQTIQLNGRPMGWIRTLLKGVLVLGLACHGAVLWAQAAGAGGGVVDPLRPGVGVLASAARNAIGPGSVVKATQVVRTVSPSADTSVNITYDMDDLDVPATGFYCSSVNGSVFKATPTLPCPRDAIFSTESSSSNFRMLSREKAQETINVPAAVSLYMYQRLRPAGTTVFYFVRSFTAGGGKYVAVPLRLSGAPSQTPLSLNRVELAFTSGGGRQPMRVVQRDASVGPLSATVDYQGTGVLKGRWEVVQPGDPEPTDLDLTAEASLDPQQQLQQQRFLQVGSFEQSLYAGRRVVVPGPAPDALPTSMPGRYLVLWRPEATASNSVSGRELQIPLGGMAGFLMPTLSYYVVEQTKSDKSNNKPGQALTLGQMPAYEMGQVVVAMPDALSGISLVEVAASVGAILRNQAHLEALHLRIGVLQFTSDALARQAVDRLKQQYPGIEVDLHACGYVQQQLASRVYAASNEARHYALALMGMSPVRADVAARIGIIDTGLKTGLSRQLLAARSVHEQSFISPIDRPASLEHGTAVASAIVGRAIEQGEGRGFSGLAPGAQLFQANVMHEDRGFAASNTFALGLAMNWMALQKVDVLNMSLASRGDKVLQLLVSGLSNLDIPVVAAVGPGAQAPSLIYPAAYPGVIAVASVDAARQPDPRGAKGAYVALSAPGVEVWLPVVKNVSNPNPSSSTAQAVGAYYTGSSFAAPWVTAAVARLKSTAGKTMSAAQLVSQLCAGATRWPEPAPQGVGCGVLHLGTK
jgi:hypothetical protein